MNCKILDDALLISLPITMHTGKVRIKRPVAGGQSVPVASCSNPMQAGDYLEWQISYDTDSLNLPSVLPAVVLNKKQGVRYGCELAWLVQKSCAIGILPQNEYLQLKSLLNEPMNRGIEESELIRRKTDLNTTTLATARGFVRHILQVPNYLKTTELFEIEIRIAHKQRAIGNQAMVFVNLPITACKSQNSRSLVGRCANSLEQADYVVDKNNVGLIVDTVTAFAIASQTHRADLKTIFEKL